MTATERLFRGDSDEYMSMDDPRDYGNLIYELSFKEAINSKPPIISDYKIITFGITNPEIEAITQDNKYLEVKKELKDITARELATAIALRKAIKKLKIKNAISFHRSIKRADNFRKQQDLITKIYPDYGKLKTFHVKGDMPTSDRALEMLAFEEEQGLMTNARCLTEGVDLPAIDCVCFTDPKRSKVDIVQAAGRALRLAKGKKFGYILIPIFIPDGMDFDEAAEEQGFDDVSITVRALATTDGRIAEYLRVITEGKKPIGGSPVEGITSVNNLYKIEADEFDKAIKLKIWDKISKSIPRPYEEACKVVLELKIKSSSEYFDFKKLNKMPKDMPWSPQVIYKNKGWKTWGEFLGTGRIADNLIVFPKYEEAKNIVSKFNIKSASEYKKLNIKNKFPIKLPLNPHTTYSLKKYNSAWKSWGEFLGTGYIAPNLRVYRKFELARKFARSLNVESVNEWIKLCKKGKVPNDIPQNPHRTYKKYFISYEDFLNIHIKTKKRNWISFKGAKDMVLKKKIVSQSEYKKFVKNKPTNLNNLLPSNPNVIYKNQWKNWGDFLGTGAIAARDMKYWSFSRAKKYIQKLNLSSGQEFKRLCKEGKIPKGIPTTVQSTYRNKGWVSMSDFLGSIHRHNVKYISFIKAKKIVLNYQFTTVEEFKKYFRKNVNELNKLNLSFSPDKTYKNKGWKNWGDFLGSSRNYLNFKEARKFILKENINSLREWIVYSKKDKPRNIPYSPNRYYKKEWKGWGHFLGTGRVQNKTFVSYKEAQNINRKYKIPSGNAYRRFVTKNKQLKLHYKPHKFYKKEWVDWSKYLGVQVIKRNDSSDLLNYSAAKKYLKTKKLNFKQWMKYKNSKNFPNFLPRYPKEKYSNNWKGWPDFLGKKTN